MSTGPDVQATFVATLVDEWLRAGVTDAVVAPGSRSTPVLAALAADDRIRLHVVLDERSGGFMALGLGLAGGRPAPVVTTSGTAAVELHPAVVEAHQAGVPMIVVTADRPAELHHVGAPQTVEQVGLYGDATRWAVTCGVPDDAATGTWRSLASRTVADAVAHPSGPGPVHLNLELREPLLGTPGPLPPGRPGGAPWHRVAAPPGAGPSSETVEALLALAGGDGLIVAGAGAPPVDTVLALADALGWPVLADPRSGCRVPHPLVVAAADGLLRVPEVAALRPAAVLQFGRPAASKVLGQWLAAPPVAATRVLVDPARVVDRPGQDRRRRRAVRPGRAGRHRHRPPSHGAGAAIGVGAAVERRRAVGPGRPRRPPRRTPGTDRAGGGAGGRGGRTGRVDALHVVIDACP